MSWDLPTREKIGSKTIGHVVLSKIKNKKSTYSTYFAFYMVDNQCLSGRSMVENRTTMDLPSTYQVPEGFRTFKPSSQILAISDQ